MNFSEYLTRIRIQHAIDLIDKGSRDIGKISADCGYRDSVYFSKVFKRYLKKTPNQYIKSQK